MIYLHSQYLPPLTYGQLYNFTRCKSHICLLPRLIIFDVLHSYHLNFLVAIDFVVATLVVYNNMLVDNYYNIQMEEEEDSADNIEEDMDIDIVVAVVHNKVV